MCIYDQMLYSSVISLIKLSINIAVFGSKPELGSSQNNILINTQWHVQWQPFLHSS
jgi:hypothetical protein